MKKQLLSLTACALAALLSLTACGGSKQEAEPAGDTKENAYYGAAMGKNADVKVEVIYADGKIQSVTVLEHKETPSISDGALVKVPEAIVAQQTPNVEKVAGASFTSRAIMQAVTQALTEAGVDVKSLG